MADANYKLTLGPLIDTIFVFEIGGQYVNSKKLEGTLKNVFYNETGVHIRLELGGLEKQKWALEVSIEDGSEKLQTIPPRLEGTINRGGGSWFDRTCPLMTKKAFAKKVNLKIKAINKKNL